MDQTIIQRGILDPIPQHATYLVFNLVDGADPRPALRQLAGLADGRQVVVGVGLSLVNALGRQVEGLRDFPTFAAAKVAMPSNRAALWCWLRADERGTLAGLARKVCAVLDTAFVLDTCVDAFLFKEGRDLTGYVDGTENPVEQAAVDAAIAATDQPGLRGASFVAVQQWLHRWNKFDAMQPAQRDDAIGRRLSDNEELDDAPASAHVKRTAQEDFEPEAFVLRRSMPWSDGAQSGFYFVAFGYTLDAFEAQLRRMSGAEDGIVDGLFSFTEPQNGYYFWCPPVRRGMLDLSRLLD